MKYAPWIVLLACTACGCVERAARSTQVDAPVSPVETLGSPLAASDLPVAMVPELSEEGATLRIRYGDRKLVLMGRALCEWGFLGIDLYRAALYVEEIPGSVEEALRADRVMVLHLAFLRQLTGEQLAEAYTASVKVNTGPRLTDHEAALRELVSGLETVEAGDHYSFVLDPDLGLLVQRDGKTTARIADPEFRQLFLRLYLGDKPPTKALRRGLLGPLAR